MIDNEAEQVDGTEFAQICCTAGWIINKALFHLKNAASKMSPVEMTAYQSRV